MEGKGEGGEGFQWWSVAVFYSLSVSDLHYTPATNKYFCRVKNSLALFFRLSREV